ncbi:hypothetical protein D3C81_1545840 [compost metagenome]
MAVANRWAMEPASEMPEKPEPSRPVMAPVTVRVTEPTTPFSGTDPAKATPRSFTIPWDAPGRTLPNSSVNAASPR